MRYCPQTAVNKKYYSCVQRVTWYRVGGTPSPGVRRPLAVQRRFTHKGFLKGAVGVVKMKTITTRGDRLQQLKTLASVLASSIDACDDARALPALAKQYRETVREIEEIEGASDNGDEISEILQKREADGKPGAVRKNRAAVPDE